MKRWLNILIIFCVLLTASSLKADGESFRKRYPTYESFLESIQESLRPVDVNSDEYKKERYRDFIDIKSLYKKTTCVWLLLGDAEKIGLDKKELTDYLRLKIKNNFANISFEGKGSPGKQLGYISLRVHVVGDNYPVAYHLKYQFRHTGSPQIDDSVIWENDIMLGYGSKDTVPDMIREDIDTVIRELAILFFKVRGEL